MNPVLKFPEVEGITFKYTDHSGYGYSSYQDQVTNLYMTPYADRDIEQIINQRGIRVPFKSIITRDQGVSECPHCKAKFTGHQPRCTAKISWMKLEGEYRWDRGDIAKGAIYRPSNGYDTPKKVAETKVGDCGTHTKWTLEKDFTEQQNFFEFVNFVNRISLDSPSVLKQYRESLPPGSADEYRILFLEQELMNSRIQLNTLENWVKTIVDKMNSAGHNLSF